MRNLRKLFYVACAVFFFTSCEETYNDKLFWPGEISQEYEIGRASCRERV